jgi:hypothetical protein
MSIRYGLNSKRVSSSDIYHLSASNMTITSTGNDARGSFYVTAYVNADAPGCGNPNQPSIWVLIKNEALLGWTRMTHRTYATFKSSCWYLNESTVTNNIQSFSTSSGDRLFRATNCFELPQFKHQTFACDNETTNAFHSTYAIGDFREWYQTRRRNSMTAMAGPGFNLSCNTVGSGSMISISDIFLTTN